MEIFPCTSYKSCANKHTGESGCHRPPLPPVQLVKGTEIRERVPLYHLSPAGKGKVCDHAGRLALKTEG